VWHRVRGEFRYGRHAGFAALSLQRFLPHLIVLAALLAPVWLAVDWRKEVDDERNASRILATIGNGANLEEGELDVFWALAQASDRVKLKLVQQALLPGNALKLERRAAWIVQSAVGVNPDLRRKVMENVSSPLVIGNPVELEGIAAWLALCRELNAYPSLSTAQIDQLFEGTEKTAGHNWLRQWAMVLKTVAAQLKPEQAQTAFDRLVDAMQTAKDADELEELADGLKAMTRQLRPRQTQAAFDRLLIKLMQKTADRDTLQELGKALTTVASQMKPQQAQAAFDQLVEMLRKTENPDALLQLTSALATVTGKVEQAPAAFYSIVDVIHTAKDMGALQKLGEALNTATRRLKPEQTQPAFDRLVDAMRKGENPGAQLLFARAISVLAAQISKTQQAKAVFDQLIEVVQKTTDYDAVQEFGEALDLVARQVKPEQMQATFERLYVLFMKKTADHDTPMQLAEALRVLAGQMKPEWALYDRIVKAMPKAFESEALIPLMRAWLTLRCRLHPEEARGRLDAMVMQRTGTPTSPFEIEDLEDAVKDAGGRLEPKQATAVFDRFVELMQKAKGPDERQRLDHVLKTVAAQLKPEQAQTVFDQLVEVTQMTTDHGALEQLGEALRTLTAQLDPDQMHLAFGRIVQVMPKTTNPDVLRCLAVALNAVAKPDDCFVVVEVLKWPNIVGDERKPLLEILERSAVPKKFHGDLWEAVEWADAARDANGRAVFDVRCPPSRWLKEMR
jgi:hypothetical protein